MLIEKEGNLIDFPGLVIAHGVNSKGKMGAGTALEIKEKYPLVFAPYQKACETGELKLGEIQVVKISKKRWIANLCTQVDYGRDVGRKYADVNAIRSCIAKLILYLKKENINEFAMRHIGCNLGGLNWDMDVLPVVRDLSKDFDIIIYQRPGEKYQK